MADEPRYRADLYRATAEYYDRFRPPYPPALLDDLRAIVPLGVDDRLLDLAAGTGQIAFALGGHVAGVVAVDQEPDMVAFGRRKAAQLAVGNIDWIQAAAEDVSLTGSFRLVAIGNAFHRLDRAAVAEALVPRLTPRGCVALLWSDSPWRGDRPWQLSLAETLARWQDITDARGRVPDRWRQAIDTDPNEDVLRRAGLTYEGTHQYATIERWRVETLIGYIYSTSFLNRTVLGDRSSAFEEDLRDRLLTCCPDGIFEQELTFALELARRPDTSWTEPSGRAAGDKSLSKQRGSGGAPQNP